MTSFKSFEEIIAWQKARVLTKEIYLVSNKGKFDKDFSLKDQEISSVGDGKYCGRI